MRYDYLISNSGIELHQDTVLTEYSTIKLRSRGSIAIAKNHNALSLLLQALKKNKHSYQVIGMGANTFLKEEVDKLLVKIDFQYNIQDIETNAELYCLPANVLLSQLTRSAIRNGHVGWEALTGIPATLGGAIAMNAGTALGEIKDIIKDVTILDRAGKSRTYIIDAGSFSYRKNHFLEEGDVIVGASIKAERKDPKIGDKIKEYYEYRKRTQPLSAKTCGCLFKNATLIDGGIKRLCRAGQYLDVAGLKGLRVGEARLSPIHANFLENIGGATYSDIINFIKIIQTELKFQYGFEFDLEVRL